MSIGMYILTHIPTGMFYIGSSQNIERRLAQHRQKLNLQVHPNHRFQKVFQKWDDVKVETFLTETVQEARDKETELLKVHVGSDLCFNYNTDANNPAANVIKYRSTVRNTGYNSVDRVYPPKKTKEEISKIAKERRAKFPLSAAARERISQARSRLISIEGTEYPNARVASESLGLAEGTIYRRITSKSTRFKDWHYVIKTQE